MIHYEYYMKRKAPQLITVTILLLVVVAIGLGRQSILDWWALRGYTAPANVAALGTQDTMTSKARHLLYVNHPVVASGKQFTGHCPAGSEKTVVLGCYVGNDAGIYVYQVTDARLNGVEQVTAAHEMLHAAYRRLSSGERTKVDAMLTDYYEHGLTDQRVKDTIAAYKKSEPHDVVNEMHSVFGTEIAELPAPLETYYRQYFANRAAVTGYTASYQAEFTDRQAKVAAYDTQLKTMKQQIDTDQAALDQQKSQLTRQAQQLDSERSGGQIGEYNAGVASYNHDVQTYNALLAATKDLIQQYNGIVDARNALALEEQQLTQELSANALPSN
jgi:hypothetical protein